MKTQFFALVWLGLLAVISPAQADATERVINSVYAEIGYRETATPKKPKQKLAHKKPSNRVAKQERSRPRSRAPAVAAWIMTKPGLPAHYMAAGQCAYPIAISGSAALDDEAAEASAQKALREQIEMDLGQAYMDLDNAKEYGKICTTASAGGIVGQFQRRCKIIAIPCRPPLIEGAP